NLQTILDSDYGCESYAAAASNLLNVQLDARDFRNMLPEDAETRARDEAYRLAETQIYDAIEENLPYEEEESEWNWEALAKWSNVRWGTNYRDRDLKKIGRDNINEVLIAQSTEGIAKIDLSELAHLLDPEYGVKTACNWLRDRFGVEM